MSSTQPADFAKQVDLITQGAASNPQSQPVGTAAEADAPAADSGSDLPVPASGTASCFDCQVP